MSVRSVIGGTIRGACDRRRDAWCGLRRARRVRALQAALLRRSSRQPVPRRPPRLALQQRIEALRLSLRETERAIEAAVRFPGVRRRRDPRTVRSTNCRRHRASRPRTSPCRGHPQESRRRRYALVARRHPRQRRHRPDAVSAGRARCTDRHRQRPPRPNHPTMRALNAQRDALTTDPAGSRQHRVRPRSRSRASTTAQIALLQSQLPALATVATTDIASLDAQAAAQRIELDGLVDAYFNIPASAAAAPAAAPRELLSLPTSPSSLSRRSPPCCSSWCLQSAAIGPACLTVSNGARTAISTPPRHARRRNRSGKPPD